MSRALIAILRGVEPAEVVGIGEALLASGIDRMEVPLNSPDPLRSISLLVDAFGGRALIGAGTVLDVDQANAVADAGGRLIVSPDCNPAVIEASKARGMASFPGVQTATDCFTALRHGADGLKFFPASLVGPDGLKALGAVLPPGTETYAVGGVGEAAFGDWLRAGVTGFGIGSELYRPSVTAEEVGARAERIVAAFDRVLAEAERRAR